MQSKIVGGPGMMARVTTGNVMHHALETEISVIYGVFKKTQELI